MRRARTAAIVLALAALAPIAGHVAPDVFNADLAGSISFGLIIAAEALSLNLLMGYAGQVSLGHGAFVGTGAVAAGLIAGKAGLPFILALPVAAIAGGLFAFIVGLPALRIRGLYLAISTVAFGEAMAKFVFPLNAVSGGTTGVSVPRPRFGSYVMSSNADFLAIIIVVFALLWWIDRNVVASRLGRSMFGIREDEDVAASFGVNVAHTKLVAFVAAGMLAGIAGALHGAFLGLAQSNVFDFDDSLFYVSIVVVGGLGSRVGVATAGASFAAFPRLLTGLLKWRDLVGASLLVFTIARHPGGIAQAMREAAERKRRPAEDADDDIIPTLPRIHVERPRVLLPPEQPLLVASGVSVRFGGLQALDGAGMTVRRGTIAGLIGPNGAGKTTFFNVLSGFQPTLGGRVEMLGRDVTRMPPHARAALGVGRTFQAIGLARNLTVTENFLLAQHTLAPYGAIASVARPPVVGRTESALRARALDAIDALGFARFADTPVKNLSGGQQRLVEIGCALVTGPELLLLDEPSAGLSPAATESLADRLRSMRDDLGLTIVLIEHHIPLVADVCDEVTVFNLGAPLAAGPTADVIADPAVVSAYLGEDVA